LGYFLDIQNKLKEQEEISTKQSKSLQEMQLELGDVERKFHFAEEKGNQLLEQKQKLVRKKN